MRLENTRRRRSTPRPGSGHDAYAIKQARPLARSLRALTASLLTSASILTAPVAITTLATTTFGVTPAAAQYFPTGGRGGRSAGAIPGGAGGEDYGCGACAPEPGTNDAIYGGGGGGGGGPAGAGAKGGDGDAAGGAGGINPGDSGVPGGLGVAGGGGGGGGAGGATGSTLFSNTAITGGAGGAGAVGGSGYYGGGGGGGGAGGYGVRFTRSGTIVTGSSFSASGGTGGVGGAGGAGTYAGSGGWGGFGGAGVYLGNAVRGFTNNGAITGGNGGTGGIGGAGGIDGGNGGFGGLGGAGLLIDGATVTNNIGGTIVGGDAAIGGAAGVGGSSSGIAGPSGVGGGNGILGYSASTIINYGTIRGGASASSGQSYGGTGIFLPRGGTITNQLTGVIQGGAGTGSGYAGFGIVAYSGTITNRGTISAGTGTSGPFTSAIIGYGLTIINSGTITGPGGGAGAAIVFESGTNVLELQAGSIINGFVYAAGLCGCGGGSNTLRFGGPVFGGIGSSVPPLETFDLSSIGPSGQYIGFSSFQVTGGAWNFTNTLIPAQTDPWTVTNGVMILSGDLSAASSITVNNNGALLGAAGILGNTQINSGGFFAPGSAPGARQTILGTFGFAGGAQYLVFVNPSGASGADATGAATLTGGTVQATFLGGVYTAGLYNILTANSVTGKFSGGLFALNTPTGFFPSLNYSTPGEVNIELSTTPPPVNGLGQNPQNVANAITNFSNNGGTVPSGIAGLFGLAGDPANHAFGQMAGQPGVAAAQSGIGSTNTFINTIFDTAFGAGGGVGGSSLGYADEMKVSPAAAEAYAAVTPRDRRVVPFTARWNVWATGYGGYSKTDGSASAGTEDTTSRVWGLVAGAEYRFSPDTKAGFVMGGSSSNFDLSGGFGNGSADAFNLAVYGKHQMGAAYVAGALGYSVQAANTKRVIGADVLEADFTGQTLSARLEGGYRLTMAPVNIAPYAALQSTTFFLPSYSEHATAGLNTFALSYDSEAITATRTELGARFDKVFGTGEGIWTLRSKLAWAHDWNTDQHATAAFQSLPGATFTVNGAEPAADSALISLGAEYGWGNGWSLAAKFDGEFSSTTSAYAGKGTLRYQW